MQTDMHYYGTYAIARSAGLHPDAARVIAEASEYVDDSDYVAVQLSDGILLDAPPTAHHPENRQNLNPVDQRRVWVPFHFLPGNEGDSFEERLICRIDSQIARDMVQHHTSLENRGFNLALMGIAAHCYADTFSHYGFSGITCNQNKVYGESIELKVNKKSVFDYIVKKTQEFNDTYIKGAVGNAAGLGHGGVSTYPDRPYLTWSFTYELGMRPSGIRENQKTFLDACEKLHAMFSDFGKRNEYASTGGVLRPFNEIKESVAAILAVEGSMEERIEAWQRASRSGTLFADGTNIPVYDRDFAKDVEAMSGHNMESIRGTNSFSFLAAAKYHRDYVLDVLLPSHGLHVALRS